MNNPRSTVFEIIPVAGDKEKRREISKAVGISVARYGAQCRHVFALTATAQAAAAFLTPEDGRLNPDEATADYYLTAVFGRQQMNKVRDLLKQQYPHWDSDIYDRIPRRVETAWKSKDPEFNVRRGFLTLNGARRLAWFQHEPIPFRKDRDGQCKYLSRGLVLHWDRALGPIEFELKQKSLDPGRWAVWRNIVSGEWQRGEGFLSSRDGVFLFRVTYDAPERKTALIDGREMEVAFSEDPQKYIICRLRKGHRPGKDKKPSLDTLKTLTFSAEEVVYRLTELKIKDEVFARRQAACGRPSECRRSEGFGKQRKYIGNRRIEHTDGRSRFVKTWNHVWTTRVARYAESEKCKELSLYLPRPNTIIKVDGKEEKERTARMFGHPWQFSQFKEMLKYKCAERGIKLTVFSGEEFEENGNKAATVGPNTPGNLRRNLVETKHPQRFPKKPLLQTGG